jgi:hypothetical protein
MSELPGKIIELEAIRINRNLDKWCKCDRGANNLQKVKRLAQAAKAFQKIVNEVAEEIAE